MKKINNKIQIQNRTLFREKGVGLIEVLIAMLLFGTALVTLSGLQTRSLQFNQSAYFRSQASMLAYDIIDRIRINRLQSSQYTIDFDDESPAGTSFREKDVKSWLAAIKTSLPDGKGKVDCGNNECTVEIRWTELGESAGDANTMMESFIYTSKI
jgi:type IV pilus assembly protein PilV